MADGRMYDARVEEVHSGDDLVLLVNLGVDGLYKRVRTRLYGVDVPNAYRACADTEAGEVRDEVRRVTTGRPCKIQVITQGRGGWVVILFVLSGDGTQTNVNEVLIGRGYVYRGKDTHKESEGTL